ncbi:putative quinol monooxygenase [Shewanella olleyana]|uniref:putative quinol monooxygenase n=1 Tax=Shewanella olleyana TaxID=135626 RepID=UPI0031FED9BF
MNALTLHTELTRKEPGCISFNVTQCDSDIFRFYVNEEFIDKAAFDFHQQRVKQSDWSQVSQLAVRHYSIIGL